MFLLETNNIKSLSAGFQNTLKSGKFIIFTVSKQINKNLYQIRIDGKYFNVKSSILLKEGAKFHAKTSWVNNKLKLNVLNDKNIDRLSLNNDILTDPKKIMILEGLIRSNMTFDPSFFNKIQIELSKNKKDDRKLIKILLLLIDKEIPINDKNIEDIFTYTEKRGTENTENHNKKRSIKKIRKVDKESIKEDIKNQIIKTDTGNELLKYFNHKIAKHDNWLIIPLRFNYNRPGQGVLKLKLNDRFIITNIVFTLWDGNDWEFSLVKSGEGRKIKIIGPKNLSWRESLPFIKLKEKLYNMDIIFDDINKEGTLTDGFTEISSAKYESIDFRV